MAVIDGCRRAASAKAYEDTDLCYLKKEDFDRLLGDTAHRALMEAANKIRETERLKRIQAEASGYSLDVQESKVSE